MGYVVENQGTSIQSLQVSQVDHSQPTTGPYWCMSIKMHVALELGKNEPKGQKVCFRRMDRLTGSTVGHGLRRGGWTREEDDSLRKCIEKYGEGNWHRIPLRAGLNRCRKSCRLRWLNYLNPNVKRGEFAADEVDLIIKLHRLLGNRWSLIAGRIPGRTANDIKNYWNTHLKMKGHREKTEQKPAGEIVKTIVIKPQARTFSTNSMWLKGLSSPAVKSFAVKSPEDNESTSWWKLIWEDEGWENGASNAGWQENSWSDILGVGSPGTGEMSNENSTDLGADFLLDDSFWASLETATI